MAQDILNTDLNATTVDKVKASKPSTPKKSDVATQQSTVDLYKGMTDEPRRQLENALTAQSEFEGLQKVDEAERESRRIGREKTNLEKYQTDIKNMPERQELKSTEDKLSQPFTPTQENFQDLATMFSLVGVLGFAIGAGGKGNSIAAMNAMNGMMEGHQQGRQDKYQREKAIFDENTKALKIKIDALGRRMEEIAKIAQTDMQKANMEADMLFAKEGADFLKQYKDKFGLTSSIKIIQEKLKGSEKLFEIIEKEQYRAAERERERQFRLDLARMQQSNARMIAEMRYAGQGGALPKDAATSNEHRFRHAALNTVKEVLDELEKPDVQKLISPLNKFTPDVITNLQEGFPTLASKLAAFEKGEFQIGGKALTQSEQRILAPIYSWRDMTPSGLQEKLKEAERSMDKEQLYLENRFPGLQQIDYDRPRGSMGNAIPSPAPAATSGKSEKVTVGGKTYSRPAGFSDADWAAYKRDVGATQ
jgi:hypothetical protein